MASTLELPAAPALPEPMIPEAFRVLRRQVESHDTVSLEVAPAGGGRKLRFAAGQFLMLCVYGVGEVPMTISSAPAETRFFRVTIRAVGAVTRALQQLKRGDLVGVRGPFGTAWPVAEAAGKDVLLVAGGTGIIALRAAMHQLFADRARFGRIVLIYGGRTPADLLFYPDFRQLKEELDLDLFCTVDCAPATWKGHVGVMTTLVPQARINPVNAVAFIAGPEVVTRFALRELSYKGLPSNRLYAYLQRNMQCGIGQCGHCQLGPFFICRDGPVLRHDHLEKFLGKAEI
jgi:NAD(P)H-flavin reductase